MAKNVKYVMSKVWNVRDPCKMDREGIQEIELGKACWVEVNRRVECGYRMDPSGWISSLFGASYPSISRVSSNVEGFM